MAKYSGADDSQMMARAEDAFRRALAINPELSIAHALYAQLEMETGRSLEAFARLLDRVRVRSADPQLFVGLVQASRYVGLLDVSRAAHARAVRLDPTVKTSIAYTAFASGDPAQAALGARSIDDPLEGFALAALRRLDEAHAGFSCLPALTCDPVLHALEDVDGFAPLRSEIEARHRHAAGILRAAGDVPGSPASRYRPGDTSAALPSDRNLLDLPASNVQAMASHM
jgi:tetratricopeptide (TPR) repeat protein